MEPAPETSLSQNVQIICLVLIALVAGGFALAQLGAVLVPFVMALLITYCLKPLTEIQVRRLRVPRRVAIVHTILLGLAVMLVTGLLATASVTMMARSIGPYRDQFQQLLHRAAEFLPMNAFGLELDLERGMFFIPEQTTQAFLAAIMTEATFLLANGALIFVFMLFMLLGTSQAPAHRSDFLIAVEVRVQRYLLVLVSLSAGTGVLVGLTFHLLGVPFALLFGFLAFLLNFIPNIGSIIATLLPLPVILLEPELSPYARILGILLPAAIQFSIGNVLAPRIYGSAMHLHPVTILLAIMFFGMIWGIAGAFLATPMLAVTKITLERSRSTQPFAGLLAGDLGILSGNADPEPDPDEPEAGGSS